jgi:transcriptional regulator GlxA family with amidase domain
MFRGSREILWEDAYSVIDAAVRADALHEWPFNQVTGQPFVSHLNQFRVAKAQHLLAATDRSIADISNEVGFGNQSYFGLVFRRATSFCPREFQRIVHSDVALPPLTVS